MNQLEKDIIKRLCETELERISIFGHLITPIVFKTNEMALFIRAAEDKFDIMIPDASDMDATRRAYAKIANIIALVQYLEAERMVYLMPGSEKSNYLCYEAQTRLKQVNPMFIEFCDGGKIQYTNSDDDPPRIIQNDRIVLQSIIRNPGLFNELFRIMGAAIFPTTRLYEFYNNGFMSVEQKQAEDSINEAKLASKRAKIANIIALVSVGASILIGAASPFVSVHYGNEKGWTEIKAVQFDSIMKVMDANCNYLQKIEKAHCINTDSIVRPQANVGSKNNGNKTTSLE